MYHRGKNRKRGTEGLSSPSGDRVSQWECLPGNEENCFPAATSSPLLCRKFKKRRQFKPSPKKLMKQELSSNFEKCESDDSKNDSSLLINDDSFISHLNFEKLDQLSAPVDQSSIAPAAPLSPQLFEEPSPVKPCESQGSTLLTQASLGSTLSSQPVVTRIQKSFRIEEGQLKDEGERRKEEMVAALEECAHSAHQSFNLGPFFGLNSCVLELLKIHRGITKLYEWQEDCIIKGGTGSNLLISMPTSGGKTLVAEVLVWQQLLLKNRDALFILPYVALVQEKVRDLSPFGVELDFLVEEYASSRGTYPPARHKKKRVVYVATIEKALGLVNSLMSEDRMKELGLVVVDEVHMVGEGGGRGATLENLLTTLRYTAPCVQMLAMSATVGNINELAEFLGAETYENNFRPVQLIEYVMMEQQLCQINKTAKTEADLFINNRTCTFNSRDHIGVLVEELVPEHSCLVFCPTKLGCENEALNICKGLPKTLKRVAYQGKKALFYALHEEGESLCPILRKTIPYGIAYHHSGLTDAERHLLEEAYLQGTICIICCTSTLAAGINLPARRVIIRSPYTGRAFLTRARYKQMSGRAGRAGLSSCGESYLIIDRRDLNQVGKMLVSAVENCVSTLAEGEYHGLTTLLFNAIGLGVAVSLPELRALANHSLLALQASDLNVDVSAMVVDIIEKLRSMELVRIKQENEIPSPAQSLTASSKLISKKSSEASSPPILETLNQPVEDKDTLTVSRLGRAAIKGNVKFTVAQRLYNDLLEARDRLSVNTYLHLIHLVIPYENVHTVQINPTVFNKAHSMLGVEELKLANALRIHEGVIARMMSGKKIKNVAEEVLKRFYSAMKLQVMWCKQGVWEASVQLGCERGELQQLVNATTAFASCVSHFCAELEQLWAFRDLLVNITQILSGCCVAELLPLLDLPGVKKGRAKMMYKAGLKTPQDVAKCEPRKLMQAVTHLSYTSALQIINSAKMLLIDKAEVLQMEAEEMIMGLTSPSKLSSAETPATSADIHLGKKNLAAVV